MPVVRPELPYHRSALQPHFSTAMVQRLHEHEREGVEALNRLVAGTALDELDLPALLQHGRGRVHELAVQAAQQALFWQSVHPRGGEPSPATTERVTRDFGSLEALQQRFTDTALSVFGSGWVCLVQHPGGRLGITRTPNAVTPLTGNDRVLLACNLWEHAYYLDFRNDRKRYLQAYWELLNWEQLNRNC